MSVTPTTVTAPDGTVLEGELAEAPAGARARAVLCHPHPQFGGTMRSLVISELFRALPAAGITALRFNFRGVEGSAGSFDEGRGERLDVVGALDALDAAAPGLPLVLVGWSFGADMALSTPDARVAGWVGIAIPLRFADADALASVAGDARPKQLILAEHDEFREATWVADQCAPWRSTTAVTVPGASHFFVGRTDRVNAATIAFVDACTA